MGGESHKSKRSDDCCKSVLSGDAAHMDSQHPQIHAQDKAIQNPSMHEEGSKVPPPCGEPTPTWTSYGKGVSLIWAYRLPPCTYWKQAGNSRTYFKVALEIGREMCWEG